MYDVIVIGGGPAGSTVSTLLVQKGYHVLLVEKFKFPRFHIGESLNPQNLKILDRLKATQLVQRAGFVIKHGAIIQCGRHECHFHFRNSATPNMRPLSYQVTRAEFDHVLLDNAERHGVEVLQEAAVVDVQTSLRSQRVRYRLRSGVSSEVACRLLVDASGRAQVLARRYGLHVVDTKIDPRATYAHYRGVLRDEPPLDGYFRTILFHDGWFWCIPLKDEVMSIGLMTNGDFRLPGESNEAHLDRMIDAVPEMARRMKGATRITPVYKQEEMSYDSRRYSGDGFVLVGDAAFFLDPVFSTGVYIGMRCAEIAADEIDLALHADDVSDARFENYNQCLAAYHRSVWHAVTFFYNGLRHEGLIELIVRMWRAFDGNSWLMRRFQDFGNGLFVERKTFMAIMGALGNSLIWVLDGLERLRRRPPRAELIASEEETDAAAPGVS